VTLLDGKQLKTRSAPLDRLAKDMLAVRLGTTFTVAATTLGDVTGLTLPLRAGSTYLFDAELLITCTGNTTVGLSINYSGTASAVAQAVQYSYLDQNLLPNELTRGLGNTALNTALADGGRQSTTARPAQLRGSIVCTTAGNLVVRAQRSAATVTILAGSSFEVREL
jgi:hypothetical protein